MEPESTGSEGLPAGDAAATTPPARPLKQPRRQAECAPVGAAPPSIAGWRVYAVDAHSLIFQVFHALPEMTSPRGEPVGAVFGFVRDMLDLIEKKQPDALDLRLRSFRPDVSRRNF